MVSKKGKKPRKDRRLTLRDVAEAAHNEGLHVEVTVAGKEVYDVRELPAGERAKAVVDHVNTPINPGHYKSVMRRSSTFDPGFNLTPEEIAPYHERRTGARVEVVDVIETFVPNSAQRAHALTYLLRAGDKLAIGESRETAMIRDLTKAAWWILREVEYLGGPQNPLNK
jgi:hypothetical protein